MIIRSILLINKHVQESISTHTQTHIKMIKCIKLQCMTSSMFNEAHKQQKKKNLDKLTFQVGKYIKMP